ncbi:alpha/beta-hydrolase [Colletotrichum sublineola]|nr:alpha/beta-hydrolase [Colletotrichum sublineola]
MGTPVIFVSLNYRMGAFGMLAGSEAEKAGVTNILLHDLQQALAWLKENIAEFGGDPSSHCVRAAIMESGSPYHVQLLTSEADKEASFTGLLNATNYTKAPDALACLRKAPASSLLKAASNTISVDGEILPESGPTAMANGHCLKVPILNRN